jgi:hypothetical protein
MVSARRKYPGVADHTTEPVTTAPVSEVAKAPDAVEAPQPVEELEPKPSPAEAAASSAIQQRLEETKRAQHLVREQAAQYAAEPETPPQMDERDQFEAAIQHLPPRIQTWYRNDPSWLTDPERNARLNYVHHVAVRETGGVGTPEYFDRMEHMMGLREKSPEPSPERSRTSAPAPRQQSAPVSAPPSRESASMSTGRPVGRVSLTREESDLARSLGLTSQQYLDGKARMLREKSGGFHRDE